MQILKYITLSILFLLASNQDTSAQIFIKKEGAATDIAISPKDGSVYVVGISKNVFKYDTRSKKFKPFGKQSKNVKSISVHSNGSLYMVSTSNDVYIDVNGRWNLIPGIKTNEVDIDKNGNVRALDLSGKLYNLYQGKWQLKSLVNKNTSGFNQLIGQDSKILYARFKNNNFKQFKSGKWVTLNGSPLKITMDDKTGEVYAVGRNKGIYKWNKNTKEWVLLKGTRKDLKDVAVHNGKIWVTATNKNIYYYDSKSIVNNSPKDYSGTYRVTIEKLGADKNSYYFGTVGVYLEAESNNVKSKISPLNGKSNRVLDISKTQPRKVNDPGFNVSKYINNNATNRKIESSLNIDMIREFKLLGDAANGNATFDIQMNLKLDGIGNLDLGAWERIKINVKDLILNKDYVFLTTSKGSLVFKIEKQ